MRVLHLALRRAISAVPFSGISCPTHLLAHLRKLSFAIWQERLPELAFVAAQHLGRIRTSTLSGNPYNSNQVSMKTSSYSWSTGRNANSFASSHRIESIVRRFAHCCSTSVSMWAITTASQAGHAICVASVPMWVTTTALLSGLPPKRKEARAVTASCVGFQRAARSPNAREERRRARPGCGGEREGDERPKLERIPSIAGLPHPREKEASHTHTSRSPFLAYRYITVR